MKRQLCIFLCIVSFAPLFLQNKIADALENTNSIEETITRLKKIAQTGTNSEKLQASGIVASLQEQFGEYTDASFYYTNAATLVGTHTEQGQEFLLGAVRCALMTGDVSRADFLLSTAFPSDADDEIKASVKVYAVWSWIIKAETDEELKGPISVLQSYVTAKNMVSVKPSILITLFYLTDEKKWSDQLVKEFPHSPETAIVLGKAQTLPVPFWFFNNKTQ